MMTEYGGTVPWQEDLLQLLRKNEVTLFCYVPDGGHKTLINRSIEDAAVTSVPLTTEEEGVATCAGCHLGGTKSVLLMQSSGVGNCINMLGGSIFIIGMSWTVASSEGAMAYGMIFTAYFLVKF